MTNIDFMLPARMATEAYMAPITQFNNFVSPVLAVAEHDRMDSCVRGVGIYYGIAEKNSMGVSARPPLGQAVYHMRTVTGAAAQACVSIPTGAAALLWGILVGICRGKEAARIMLANYAIPITAFLYAYLGVSFALSFRAAGTAAKALL